MSNKFYEFNHECDAMPDGVSFCKICECSSSQFTVETRIYGAARQSATLYGFRYCPYCGEDMEVCDERD